ncbi:MAG TPA: IS110 family transposase [Candidatus Bathyarchaeia archaeon]|jgi:transposase|nr:IS110 family transposase [Candidatus Bathyarchaeia archaeon]
MKSNKTEKIKTINEKTLIVALDIGKNVHYGYFRTPKNKDIKPFPIYNTGRSFKKFWGKLCRFKEEHMLDEVVIGFESTGPYAEPIANYLRKKPVNLVQVNPMHTKRVKDLTGNSPNKTDKKDPRVIADVISLGHSLTVVIPEGAAAQLRRLTHARERSIERRTAMNNQLQQLVFVIFPELVSIIKPSTKTGMYLIKNFPDPERIASIGIESLSDIIRQVSRGRFGIDRAEALYNAAKQSVGITEGKESVILETSHLVFNIENENRYIKSLEEQIIEHLEQIPYSHSILSVKGIGHVTTAGLIGEVGDFNKFNTISEITKLAGLDLFEISSGKHTGQRRISKRGRPMMRKLLFFAAINMVKSNGIMHAKYKQMLDRGMLKMKALIAISRKVLGLIFAIVRNSTMYIENYTKQNHYKLAA